MSAIVNHLEFCVNHYFESGYEFLSDEDRQKFVASAEKDGKVLDMDSLDGIQDISDVGKEVYTSPRLARFKLHHALREFELSLPESGHFAFMSSTASNMIYRMGHCDTHPVFADCHSGESGSVKKRNLKPVRCHSPACPYCVKADSNKLQLQARKVVDAFVADYTLKHGFKPVPVYIVLTCKNCSAFEIPFVKMVLQGALDYLFGCKKSTVFKDCLIKPVSDKFASTFANTLQTWECTINFTPDSEFYGTFHPHINLLSFVPESYFKNRHYFKQSDLEKLWIDCIEKSCARLSKKLPVQLLNADWHGLLLAFRASHYGQCYYMPIDEDCAPDGVHHVSHFDSSRFIDYNSGVGSVSVYMRRVRGSKGRTAIDAALSEVVKYMNKLDDLFSTPDLSDSDLVYFGLGYSSFASYLKRVSYRGELLDTYKRLHKSGALEDLVSSPEVLNMSDSDSLVLQVQDIFNSSSSRMDSVLLKSLSGSDAVQWCLDLASASGCPVSTDEDGLPIIKVSDFQKSITRLCQSKPVGDSPKKRGRRKQAFKRLITDDGYGNITYSDGF